MYNHIYNGYSNRVWADNRQINPTRQTNNNNSHNSHNGLYGYVPVQNGGNIIYENFYQRYSHTANHLNFYFNNNTNTNSKNYSQKSTFVTRPHTANRRSVTSTKTTSGEEEASSDITESDSLELSKLLNRKTINQETAKKLLRNQNCLSLLIEGDLIEYVEEESYIESKEFMRKWAIFMGNTMIMRYDAEAKAVVYESYWRIADKNYIFINREFDKRLCTLPIYEILKRARVAHSSKRSLAKLFSSDRNFAMWCRFDINKSDIELSTDKSGYSPSKAKEFLLQRFINSLDQAEENELIWPVLPPRPPSTRNAKSKAKLTFYFYENKNRPKKL